MNAKLVNKIENSKTCIIKVKRSNNFIYGQAIDAVSKNTIVSYSSLKIKGNMKQVEKARMVGEELALLVGKKYNKFIFDRNRYVYHGQVKSLADGLRKKGIKI